MRKFARTLLAVAGCAGFLAGTAHADDNAIKYRQSIYKAIGGHTQALGAIVKKEVPYTDDAVPHARALGALGPMVKHIFPEGSGTGDTGALPVIWERPADFEKVSTAFIDAAVALGEAAEAGPDAIPPAFVKMVDTCKTCHDTFRKKAN